MLQEKVVVEAIREEVQPHNLEIMADEATRFLGLDGSATGIGASGPAGPSIALHPAGRGVRIGTIGQADSPAG